MPFDLSTISKTNAIRAPRLIVYGGAGIGKTTFAANAPSPIFVFTEDGAGDLVVDAFPLASSFDQVMGYVNSLATQDHEFKTIVLDSLDHLEPIIWKETCIRNNWSDIEQPGYGKGYIAASDVWREFFSAVDNLRNQKGMCVIYLAHHEVKQVSDPTCEPYDRFQIKLQKRASELAQEWVDAVLFATKKTVVIENGAGFKKVARGISTGERVIYTQGEPSYLAKNRYSLPSELPLSWSAFQQSISKG